MYRTIGIDIGTAFITAAANDGVLINRRRHCGRIHETLLEIVAAVDDNDMVVFTGKGGRDTACILEGEYHDEAAAYACLLAEEQPFGAGSGCIIDIGASSLTLYAVTGDRISDISENTLCAAGTGLFLEEQARRLNIDLENTGASDIEQPPLIASRCTVFAKSDLIHHQQEGRTITEMWAGLCRSLVVSAMNTLFRGREMKGDMMICGGVSLNSEVLRWFSRLCPQARWVIPPYSAWAAALGAAHTPGKRKSLLRFNAPIQKSCFQRMPSLTLRRSSYPPATEPHIDENGNEIRIYRTLHQGAEIILGMDIGSTSTKIAILDALTLEPLLDIYGKTAGDPIRACQSILDSFRRIANGITFTTRAAGTTGSGRFLAGKLLEADRIINEISAHARGARHFFPDVETIFEIGGQDAKYIRLHQGFTADVNMNYVCAAGTGSFVEEQARKLGFAVDDIGKITENIAPPVTSDRCTVFMEQDLADLLKEGFSREEALASVLYSVIRNYLNRVVGNRPISEKVIFFQGATARNKGLAAALENLMNVEIKVSPFCHIMGAIGAALIARDHCFEHFGPSHLSSFSGLRPQNLCAETISRMETCKLCRNVCRINYIARPGGAEFSWGYQCGRDPGESSRREIPEFKLFKLREKIFYSDKFHHGPIPTPRRGSVTIVAALTHFTFYPLWHRFFLLLGCNPHLSGHTGQSVKTLSAAASSADFCFPAKVVIGHVLKAAEKIHPVFLPHMIAHRPALATTNSFFCPFMQSAPSFVRSTLARNGHDVPLIAPVADFRRPFKEIALELYKSLKPFFTVKRKEVLRAFHQAFSCWKEAGRELEAAGGGLLEQLAAGDAPFFILVGRSYNLHDSGLNLGIPEKIASMGFPVIPMDMLNLDNDIRELAHSNYHNLFWSYGQRIIAAIRLTRRHRNAFAVYLSNFNCGPDSFLLGFAEEEMKGKPMLALELDELDSDGGYLTRIEAFLDVALSFMKQEKSAMGRAAAHRPPLPHIYTPARKADLKGGAVVWMPPMHPNVSLFLAAAFRAFGYQSCELPPEDDEVLALGKKHLRGGECLPMTLTLGAFIRQVQKERDGRHFLFMPTTDGPCRFGQYNLMDRIVFNNLGLENVDIISPSSMNGYQGLEEGLRRFLMHAVMACDLLMKLACRVRPYERRRGETDALFAQGQALLVRTLERRGDVRKTVREIAAKFAALDVFKEKKPLVGIVGEIYVRCNTFSNGDLIRVIEENGGEAWLTPMHEWLLYVAWLKSRVVKHSKLDIVGAGEALLTWLYFHKTEQVYYNGVSPMLDDRREPHVREVLEAAAPYLPVQFQGEAILTVGRTMLFAKNGADMVVNASPFGCMPGTIAGAILLELKEKMNIPIISSFYDGDIDVNGKIASMLKILTMDAARGEKQGVQYNSTLMSRTSRLEL